MEKYFVSVKRNPAIRERMHYINESVKSACINPNPHNIFNAIASPLYLVGKVYNNFEDNASVGGNFCLLNPDKFDIMGRELCKSVQRNIWKSFGVYFDYDAKIVKFVDM